MAKNLTIFLAGIIIAALLFLCKIQFVKIVGYIIVAIIIVLGIFWTIGFIKDKKERRNKKEQG